MSLICYFRYSEDVVIVLGFLMDFKCRWRNRLCREVPTSFLCFFWRGHQVDLIDALREVAMQEPEAPWMFEDHRYILDNADRIKKVREKE